MDTARSGASAALSALWAFAVRLLVEPTAVYMIGADPLGIEAIFNPDFPWPVRYMVLSFRLLVAGTDLTHRLTVTGGGPLALLLDRDAAPSSRICLQISKSDNPAENDLLKTNIGVLEVTLDRDIQMAQIHLGPARERRTERNADLPLARQAEQRPNAPWQFSQPMPIPAPGVVAPAAPAAPALVPAPVPPPAAVVSAPAAAAEDEAPVVAVPRPAADAPSNNEGDRDGNGNGNGGVQASEGEGEGEGEPCQTPHAALTPAPAPAPASAFTPARAHPPTQPTSTTTKVGRTPAPAFPPSASVTLRRLPVSGPGPATSAKAKAKAPATPANTRARQSPSLRRTRTAPGAPSRPRPRPRPRGMAGYPRPTGTGRRPVALPPFASASRASGGSGFAAVATPTISTGALRAPTNTNANTIANTNTNPLRLLGSYATQFAQQAAGGSVNACWTILSSMMFLWVQQFGHIPRPAPVPVNNTITPLHAYAYTAAAAAPSTFLQPSQPAQETRLESPIAFLRDGDGRVLPPQPPAGVEPETEADTQRAPLDLSALLASVEDEDASSPKNVGASTTAGSSSISLLFPDEVLPGGGGTTSSDDAAFAFPAARSPAVKRSRSAPAGVRTMDDVLSPDSEDEDYAGLGPLSPFKRRAVEGEGLGVVMGLGMATPDPAPASPAAPIKGSPLISARQPVEAANLTAAPPGPALIGAAPGVAALAHQRNLVPHQVARPAAAGASHFPSNQLLPLVFGINNSR